MITTTFKIPIYEFSVKIAQIECVNDKPEIKKVLAWVNAPEEEVNDMIDCAERGLKNGAYTYRDLEKRKFLILLFPFTSMREKINTIGHEKRHIEDRLLNYCSVEDIEASAYLAGFLTEKIFYDNSYFVNETKIQEK